MLHIKGNKMNAEKVSKVTLVERTTREKKKTFLVFQPISRAIIFDMTSFGTHRFSGSTLYLSIFSPPVSQRRV